MSLPHPWDEFNAYIFDIDGTLLHCTDAVHYFAFCNVLSHVAGRPVNLDGVNAHGNTDIGILRDAFARAGVSPEMWRPCLPELCDRMCRQVEKNRAHLCADRLPYVREVLHHLEEKGALLSVATGNLERIGKQKLAAAGLLEKFQLGAWSDTFEDRTSVFRHAIAQIRAATYQEASILAIGDTPADIEAAHANDLPVIAVATGIYSSERLISESPSLCIGSFAKLFEPMSSTTASNSSAR
jgi:phosphoglycolate phosphatase